jgi:hypothetical protein
MSVIKELNKYLPKEIIEYIIIPYKENYFGQYNVVMHELKLRYACFIALIEDYFYYNMPENIIIKNLNLKTSIVYINKYFNDYTLNEIKIIINTLLKVQKNI